MDTEKQLFVPSLLAIVAMTLGAIASANQLFVIPAGIIHHSFTPLVLNTTLGMLSSGLALLFLIRSKKTVAIGFTCFTGLFSLIAFYKFFAGVGIDPNIVRQGAAMLRSNLSHVAFSTAVGFAFISSALILPHLSFHSKARYHMADILAMLTVSIGTIGTLDYFLNPDGNLQDWGYVTGMALPACIGFVLSGLGTTLALAKLNPLSNSNSGDLMAIRAFVASATIFILLWQAATSSEQQNIERFAHERSDTVRSMLKNEILDEHTALGRALSRYTREFITQNQWTHDMEAYIRDYRDLESVLLVDHLANITWSAGKAISDNAKESLKNIPRNATSYSSAITQENAPTLFVIRAESPDSKVTLFTIRNLETYHVIPVEKTGPDIDLRISFAENLDTADLSEDHYAFRYSYPADADHESLSIRTTFTEIGMNHLNNVLPESILVTGFLLALISAYSTRLVYQNKKIAKNEENARLEIQDSQNQLSAVMRATPIGMILIDIRGTISIANRAMTQIFGYTDKELLTMNVDQLVPEPYTHNHPEKRASYARHPESRSMSSRDLRGLRKNGTLVPIEVGLNPVVSNSGTFTMATIIDVTERKNFEDKLQHVNTDLRNQRDEMEQLVYIVSHDLKAPLVTIQGFSTLLKSEEGRIQDEDVQSSLDRIVKASRHMGNLIADILELSRIGRLEDTPETIDLEELIHELQEILSAETISANCQWNLIGPFPKIHASRMRINQVYQNLMSNALRYACNNEQNSIEIGTTLVNNTLQLYMKDDGPGVELDQVKRIFKLFQGSKKTGSTGVGLTIVRKVAEFYAGTAWVESPEGQGCKFIVALPKSIIAK